MEDQWLIPNGDLATGLLCVALRRLTFGSTKVTCEVISLLLGSAGWRKRKWRNISWNTKILCLEFGLQNRKNMQNLHVRKNFTSFVFVSNPSCEYCWDGISGQIFCIQTCYLIPGSAWRDHECFVLTISVGGSWKHKKNVILCQLTRLACHFKFWLGFSLVFFLDKSKRITQARWSRRKLIIKLAFHLSKFLQGGIRRCNNEPSSNKHDEKLQGTRSRSKGSITALHSAPAVLLCGWKLDSISPQVPYPVTALLSFSPNIPLQCVRSRSFLLAQVKTSAVFLFERTLR